MKKYLSAFLAAGAFVLGAQTGFAQGGPSLSSGQAPAPGMFGYTPASTPAQAVSGPKKPLEGTLSKDEKGKSAATSFTSADTIYLVWKDETGAKGDKIRIDWVAEDTGGAFPKNKQLSEYAQTLPSAGSFNSFAKLAGATGSLPAGKYRADVYDGSKLVKSVKFTVKK